MDTPNPAQPQPVTAPDEPATPAGFLVRNSVTLLTMAAFAAALIYFLVRVEDSVEKLKSVGMVAVGLGLVIFIHELGHFVAAKLCDVHVETFSIGFGPPFLGICAFKRGETTYKLAWFPLGGFVRMLGEGDDAEGAEDDPRSFKNKSVWQRMIIISAGVIMNILLAVALFVFVFRVHGVYRKPGVVGHVEPGLAAWRNGLPPGAMIRQVGRVTDPYYEELSREVNGGPMDRPITVTYETFQGGRGTVFTKSVQPVPIEEIPLPMLGIASSPIPVLITADRGEKQPVIPDTAAARAEPPLAFGDKIVGATDPDNPSQVTPLADDPRRPGEGQRDYFDLRRRLQRLAGKPITLRVERAGSTVDVRVPPAFAQTIGVRMSMGPVVAVRQGSPAADAVRPKSADDDGDKLTAVEVTRADGSKQRWSAKAGDGGDPLDPVKLPMQLALWAMSRPADWTVRLTVQRTEGHKGAVLTPLTLTWDKDWDPLDDPPTSYASSPLSLSGLGIAYQVQTVIDGVEPGSPADGKLKAGDVVKKIELKALGRKGKLDTFTREPKVDQGAHYFRSLAEDSLKEVTLTVNQGEKVTLTPREDPAWPLVDRGLALEPDSRVQKAGNLGEAFVMGSRRLIDQTATLYENLFALVTGRMSAKAIAGPISIAVVSYDFADRDVWELIMFLAMININLAVVNFLPIPVLDGGHMVFLIYEKLRGKPPSDRVRFIATICGLVIILGLMAFGFYVDIRRWFF